MSPQRDGKSCNQTVIDIFQSIILPNQIISAVKCLYCHRQMTFEVTRQQNLRYTQSIEIDEKKLLNMKDRLLQKKVAMARLNSSNNEMLKKFLNSIVDDEVTMKHSNNWCYLYIFLCIIPASINVYNTRLLTILIWLGNKHVLYNPDPNCNLTP